MAPYFVSFFRVIRGSGAYDTHVLQLDRPPATKEGIKDLEAILATERQADSAIYVSCIRLPTQEEHPCTGVPYAYWVVYHLQDKLEDGSIAACGVGRMNYLTSRPILGVEELEYLEASLRKWHGHGATVAMSLTPLPDVSEEDAVDFRELLEDNGLD
jgi:hypothetical protein